MKILHESFKLPGKQKHCVKGLPKWTHFESESQENRKEEVISQHVRSDMLCMLNNYFNNKDEIFKMHLSTKEIVLASTLKDLWE